MNAKSPLRRGIAVCVLSLGFVLPAPLLGDAPAATPAPAIFSSTYVVKHNGTEFGRSTRSLRALGDGHFIYESLTQASGVIAWILKDRIEENSTWVFHDGALRPLEYLFDRRGLKHRHLELQFDWNQNVVVNNSDGNTWHMPIPPDTEDKLLYQLAIIHDLQNGRRQLQYHVADGSKRLKTYVFAFQGEETLSTALGRLQTVRLERVGDVRSTTVWCAPSLLYLPVQLVQHETDGSEIGMYITAVKGLPKF